MELSVRRKEKDHRRDSRMYRRRTFKGLMWERRMLGFGWAEDRWSPKGRSWKTKKRKKGTWALDSHFLSCLVPIEAFQLSHLTNNMASRVWLIVLTNLPRTAQWEFYSAATLPWLSGICVFFCSSSAHLLYTVYIKYKLVCMDFFCTWAQHVRSKSTKELNTS